MSAQPQLSAASIAILNSPHGPGRCTSLAHARRLCKQGRAKAASSHAIILMPVAVCAAETVKPGALGYDAIQRMLDARELIHIPILMPQRAYYR